MARSMTATDRGNYLSDMHKRIQAIRENATILRKRFEQIMDDADAM